MSHSARLRAKIELVAPGMHRAIEAFWAHPRMPEIFPEFLYTTYCVGRTTRDAMTRGLEEWRDEWLARKAGVSSLLLC